MPQRIETNRVRREIEAALAGFAPDDPGATPATLQYIGDALRMGLEIPSAVRSWMKGWSSSPISAASRSLVGEIDGLTPSSTSDDEALAAILLKRDSVESVRVAIVRWLIDRNASTADVPALDELDRALVDLDTRLQHHVTRSAAEGLLGARAVVLGSMSWTTTLDDDPLKEDERSSLIWDESLLAVTPSDESVTRYITEGSLAPYIEGFAQRESSFAEELVATIDSALGDREEVSWIARIWRRKASVTPPVHDTAEIRILPRQRLAAATGDLEPLLAASVRLGRVGVLAAQARLVATETEISLRMLAKPGVISELRFGTSVASVGDKTLHGERWTATIARTVEPVRIRVVGTDGTVFDESLHLVES